jgi:agarase
MTNGFFRAEQRAGRWWLVDPAGKPFISKGVTTVRYAQDRIQGTSRSPYEEANQAKYGGIAAWREAVAKRLIGWGFNTLGAWSDEALAGPHLAYAPTLDFGGEFVKEKHAGKGAWQHGIFPDVFDPGFAATVRRVAEKKCAARKDDRHLLGWFTDNELRWGPDWRGKEELLTMFLALPTNAPGRVAAVDLLRNRYGDIAKFNAVWRTGHASWEAVAAAPNLPAPFTRKEVWAQNQEVERVTNEKDPRRGAFTGDCDAFVAQLAERYFRITGEAIRAADPNHLNFGCRFAYVPPLPVVTVAAKTLDGISFNCYALDPRPVIRQYAVFGKPLIIGEFAFRAEDSGLPNTKGAGPKVKNQTERAAAFAEYVELALREPQVVGYHWFEHADEPKEGRFDGENSNYGLVTIQDEPYVEFVETVRRLNGQAEVLHQ